MTRKKVVYTSHGFVHTTLDPPPRDGYTGFRSGGFVAVAQSSPWRWCCSTPPALLEVAICPQRVVPPVRQSRASGPISGVSEQEAGNPCRPAGAVWPVLVSAKGAGSVSR